MKKSFNLQRCLTQFLSAEQDRLATLEKENKKQTDPNFQWGEIYEARQQIKFYKSLLDRLTENEDCFNEFIKYSFRLWELHRNNQPTPYPFMTFQPSSKNGELFSEDADAVFISPEEIESKIGQTTGDNTSTVTNNDIVRFYSVDPKTHALILEKTYTFINQGWKRGLHITKKQYNALLIKRVVPEFELWRLWPLFSIKEIEMIVATSEKYRCDADDTIEGAKLIDKEIAKLDTFLEDINQTLDQAEQIRKELEQTGKKLANYYTLKNTPRPPSTKGFH